MRWSIPLAILVGTGMASANGRAPLTNGVFFNRADAHSMYVRTTFGLLITHDDCSFRWVCEQSIGYGGQFDPKYAIANDGTIFATTYTGLRVSRDGGCSFTTATEELATTDPGRIAGVWIDAIDIGPSGDVWVATADSGRPNNIFRSKDNGLTFVPRGMLSPTIWWKSVKVAPSDAHRIYITGYQVAGAADAGAMPPTAHLLRSDDDGDHWTESPLTSVIIGQTAMSYVVAVSPTSPDTLLYLSEGANPPNGDRLYRSIDGGATLQEVLVSTSKIKDVLFSDAQHVIVAVGAAGSLQSTDGGMTFAPLPTGPDPLVGPPQLNCIGKRGDQLFGCGANWNPDFKAIASSPDAVSWQKVTRFVELAGALSCPAGTPGKDICEPLWTGNGGLQEQFGTTGPACQAVVPDVTTKKPPTGGGCCDAGPGAPGGLGLAAIVGLVLRRRRR